MTTHVRYGRRGAAVNALVAGLLCIVTATPAMASSATTDPRWLPWVGCWAPTTATSEIASSLIAIQRVCVMPVEDAAGVDVVSVADGRIVGRVRVDATGGRRPVSREGCEGWETARFATTGGRVYLRSELVCAGGIERVSSGVIAIASPGDWVDVEVVSVNEQRSTRIIRYRSAPDSTAIDREIASALGEREMARRAARMAAAALPGIGDVIEASRELDPAVVEAWLLQRMPRFTVEARQLRQLADARVPDSVIDLVVALSRPEMFLDRLATRGYTLVRVDAMRPRVVAMDAQPAGEIVTPPVVGGGGGGGIVYDERESYGGHCDRCAGREIIYYESSSYAPYGYYPYWPYGAYPVYPVYPYYPYDPYDRRPPQQQKPAPRPPVIVHGPTYPKPPAPQPTPPAADPVGGRAIKGTGYTRSTGATGAEPTPPPPQQVVPSEPRSPRTASEVKPPPPREYTPRTATESRPAPPPSRPSSPPPQSQPAPPPESRPAPPPSRPTATEAKPRPAPPPETKPAPAPASKPDVPARTAKTRPPAGG